MKHLPLSVLLLLFGFSSVCAAEPSEKKVYKGIPTAFSMAAHSLAENKSVASSEDLPLILVAGFNQYQTQGAAAAVTEWVKGGPSETDSNSIQSLLKAFNQMETLYGKYTGYEVMQVVDLSATARQVTIQINYEKGPLFIRFLCYYADAGWIVSGRIVFATDPEKIFATN